MKQLLFVLSVWVLVGCGGPDNTSKPLSAKDSANMQIEKTAKEIAGIFNKETDLTFLPPVLDSFFIQFDSLKTFEKDIKDFYQARHFSFAWYTDSGLTEQASHLHLRLQNLSEEGLNVTIPYQRKLDTLMNSGSDKTGQKNETECLLTGLYFFFAKKVWGGMEEQASQKVEWLLPRKKLEFDILLDSILKGSYDFSVTNEPVYRQYHLLKNYLRKYKSLHDTLQIRLPAGVKSLKPGITSPLVKFIREKLILTGDLAQSPDTLSNVFDSTLLAGVKRFQHRLGMSEDGVVGASMIRSLNVSIEKRVEQLMVNMERCRWLPIDIKGPYLAVNIPEFMLHAYKDDSVLWDMKVVVGRDVNKTVIFSGTLKHIVFSPYWNVPPGILKAEVLPGIKKNPGYLAKHHMEWNGNSVRQKPGPWNSLGQVKFLFPNSHSIYFHDTPSKSLFGESRRAFSHGCIRLAEPKKLAMYLLADNATWTEDRITAAMKSGKEQYVALKDPMPVFITYLTAWVDRNGELNFRDDIYNRDQQLFEMLVKED